MAEGNGRAYSHQWAVRGPGMPQKILRSDKELSDDQIKKIYLQTVKFLESRVARGDGEVPWRIVPVSDADIKKAGLDWCLKPTNRQNHRALIEYYGGKLVGGKMVDGKFIPDEIKKPEKKKERTRVEVSASQPAK